MASAALPHLRTSENPSLKVGSAGGVTRWEIINTASSGSTALVERINKTKTTGVVDLPCVGVFEMEGGKIKAWRDYFDMATYTGATKG